MPDIYGLGHLQSYGRTNVKTGGPRDSQRSKLYNAEHALHQEKLDFPEVRDVQTYVNKVTGSEWTRRKLPNMPRNVRVDDGRGSRSARAFSRTIKMPRWSRTKLVVLHELAHCATPSRYASHGREYAANFLQLVRHFMGKDAHAKLRASFKAHRVKYTAKKKTSVTAASTRRQGNPEALVKARAALAAKRKPAGTAPVPGMVKHGQHWIHPALDRRLDVALARANGC